MKFNAKKLKHSLKIIVLGGTTDVQKNMYVYEYGQDIVIFDCGIGFPSREDYGVEVILPDFSYVLENIDKVRGILITHAHEDHLGALPYLLDEAKIPVYSVRLVQEILKLKLKERNALGGVSLNLLDPDGPPLHLGAFTIDFFRTNHSVPGSLGYSIDSPQGRILHVQDYKFDWTPTMDKPFDVQKMVRLASKGVLALCSDCLGATSEGFTKSEREIQKTFDEYIENAKGQVFITTISSNVARIKMAIDSSLKFGRKVAIDGRSMEQITDIAKKLGYFSYTEDIFVPIKKAHSHDQSKITYIIAGSFGQTNSALGRLARGENRNVRLERGALVIFSADPIPGVGDLVHDLIDELTLRGADVIYSQIQENLHVSGHGSKGDHTLLASLVKPKYFIPIGGTVSLMRVYSQNMVSLGFSEDSVFELLEGDSVTFKNGDVFKHKELLLKQKYIGSDRSDALSPVVLKDRKILAEDGIFVVILKFDKEKGEFLNSAELVSRGFIYMKESKKLLKGAEKEIVKVLGNIPRNSKKKKDWASIKEKVESNLFKYFRKTTGRYPLILPVIVSV